MLWMTNLGMGGTEAGAPVAPGPGRELMLLYVGRVLLFSLTKKVIDLIQVGMDKWHA